MKKGFVIFLVFVVIATVFLIRSPRKKAVSVDEGWIPYTSKQLGFSAQIPSAWRIAEITHRESIFFDSNISVAATKGEAEEKFYAISVKKLKLNGETLEDYFFPKGQFGEDRSKYFQKEDINGYSVYTTSDLSAQNLMVSVFITRDNKEFLRYSITPIVQKNIPQEQNIFMQKFRRILQSTTLL